MQLATSGSKAYTFLPSGILIVDPDESLLAATAILLMAAERYVAAASEEVAGGELRSVELRIAVLSQTLPRSTLERLAHEIRLYWPNAFILLLGKGNVPLEDWLYDDSIDEQCRPEDLLSILHGVRKQRKYNMQSPCSRIGFRPFDFFGAGWMSLRSATHESDPSKEFPGCLEEPAGWDVPAEERARNSPEDSPGAE
jgi:hypothetical protein